MQPQGSAPLNTEYFTAAEAQISATTNCSDLQALTTEIFASLQAVQTAINVQAALLAPIAALLTPPASPTAAVTWIASFITNFLGPYAAASVTLATQLTQLATQVALLTTAINNAAARIPGCSINVPTLT